MTQKLKSPEAARNSLARKSKTDQTASKATTLDPYTKAILTNPRFKAAKKSGRGYVIGGEKPK